MKTPVKYWGTLLGVLDSVLLTKINVLENDKDVAILVGEDTQMDLAISQFESLHIPYKTVRITGERMGRAVLFDGCRWDGKGRLVNG